MTLKNAAGLTLVGTFCDAGTQARLLQASKAVPPYVSYRAQNWCPRWCHLHEVLSSISILLCLCLTTDKGLGS